MRPKSVFCVYSIDELFLYFLNFIHELSTSNCKPFLNFLFLPLQYMLSSRLQKVSSRLDLFSSVFNYFFNHEVLYLIETCGLSPIVGLVTVTINPHFYEGLYFYRPSIQSMVVALNEYEHHTAITSFCRTSSFI